MPGSVEAALCLRRGAGEVIAQLVPRQIALRIDHHHHVEVEIIRQVLVLRRIDRPHLHVDTQLLQQLQRRAASTRSSDGSSSRMVKAHLLAVLVHQLAVLHRPTRLLQQLQRVAHLLTVVARRHRSPAA